MKMEDTTYNDYTGLTAVVDKEVSSKEQQDTSDSASCSSDTPLLPALASSELPALASNNKNLECRLTAPIDEDRDESWGSETPLLLAGITITENDRLDMDRSYVPSETTDETLNETDHPASMLGVNDKFELAGVQSTVVDMSCLPGNSISSHPEPTESSDASNLTCAPINIYCSGWEFGSVCSMNLPSENDNRSRKSTMFHNPSSFGAQQTILTKIFKDKIGSIEFRGSGKDISSCFMEPVQEVHDDNKRINNMKNLLVLSLGVTLLHIASFGLRNLQSSLNSENGLGVYSLATLCGAFMIGSLISRFVVQKFRPKICLNVAIFCHLVYIVANYFSSFYTIIPASLIQGVGSALLWNGLCTYITEIGLNEASIKNKSTNAVLSRYFGIFFLILQFSMVLGNLVSSIILSQTSDLLDGSQFTTVSNHSVLYSSEYQLTMNFSSGFNSTVSERISSRPSCGAAYCDLATKETAKPTITDMQKLTIILTYSGCAIFAIIVIQVFLDQLPNYISRSPPIKVVIKQITSVLGMVFDRQFCFIVMLCLYTIIGNGFVVADVLKIFITCPLGMKMVGYSMICFGVMGSISSYIFGKLAKCTGNIVAFLTAAILNVVSLALMVKWEPTADDQYLLFAFVGVWGFADGIWQSQINSVISSVFSDCYENAFSCCRFLQGVAGLFFFNMSNMFCLTTKIFFTMVICIISVCLYVVMEIITKKESVKEIEIEVEGSGQMLKKQ